MTLRFAPLVLCAAIAAAAMPAFADDEAARIARERSDADARYAARERECRQRFVVTACIDEARHERRATLDALHLRQRALDEAERRQRAEQRRGELATKDAEDRRRAAESAERAARRASEPARQGKPFETPNPAKSREAGKGAGDLPLRSRPAKTPPPSAAERAAQEAAKREAYGKRQREAAEHREKAVENTVRRMSRKSPASSLPVPGPASRPAGSASAPR